eukprot:12936495-Prorocentrum_lima.AAC.1
MQQPASTTAASFLFSLSHWAPERVYHTSMQQSWPPWPQVVLKQCAHPQTSHPPNQNQPNTLMTPT